MFGLDIAGTDVDNLNIIRKYIKDNPDKSTEIRFMLITAFGKMIILTLYPAVPMTIQKLNESMIGILEDINNEVKEDNNGPTLGGSNGSNGSKKISRKHIYKRMHDSMKRYHKTNNLKTTTFKKGCAKIANALNKCA